MTVDNTVKYLCKTLGPVRDLNPGPLAPKARIIPLDQQATYLASTSLARNQIDIGIEKLLPRADRLCNRLFGVLVFTTPLKNSCKFLYLLLLLLLLLALNNTVERF